MERPNENERWLGRITIDLEVVLDENPDRLAEDMATLVTRAIEDRHPGTHGNDVWGSMISTSEIVPT